MGEKPTVAFVLSLLGGIIILLAGLEFAFVGIVSLGIAEGERLESPGSAGIVGWLGGAIAFLGVLGLISGILVIVGAVMMNSGNPGKVKTGSIVVLIFSILSFFTVGGGFFIGFILGLIGGILGLTWKPTTTPPPPPRA